jgi:hypothetical protein
MTAMPRPGMYVVGCLTGAATLLAGLFELEVHPIAGILIALEAMALLLSAAAEFCQARGIHEPDLQEKQ